MSVEVWCLYWSEGQLHKHEQAVLLVIDRFKRHQFSFLSLVIQVGKQ